MSQIELDAAPRAQGGGRPAIAEMVWSPLASGVLVLLPGLLGWATGIACVFPSLAPTAVLQAVQEAKSGSRFYNVFVGHLIGVASAYGSLFALGANGEPSVLASDHVYPLRLAAAVAAVAGTVLVQPWLKALHAPAAATVLLITLGAFRAGWHDVSVIAAGVFVVAVAGEGLRRLRLWQGAEG